MATQSPELANPAASAVTSLLGKGYTPPSEGLLSKLPASWVPYVELIRLDKPHGIYMVYFPVIVGLMYASSINPETVPVSIVCHRAGVLLVWTFFLRSAGCAWNDNIDQDFDRQTERCRNRPIARGVISTIQGHVFTLALTLLLFLSIRSLPFECTLVGLCTTALATLYPFGKRFTNFPQVILGSTLASSIALCSYSVGLPAFSPPYIVPTMYLSVTIILLVIFYDVVYARQDIADDLKSGVKGMAVRFRNNLGALLIIITGLITGFLAIVGRLVDMGPYFFVFSVFGVFMALLFMIAVIRWQILISFTRHSGWLYALAIANLVSGFVLEYYTRYK